MQFVANRLLIFSKAAVPGQVKTRLIPAIGAQAAACLQDRLLHQLVSRSRKLQETEVVLYCAPSARHPYFASFPERKQSQRGRNLGERMHHAFEAASKGTRKVVLVGSDCPILDADYIFRAFTALDTVDVVLGPAEDGGYVLMGLRRATPALFRGIAWSSSRVLAQTLARIESEGLRFTLLETLWDIDEPKDLQRLPASVLESIPRRLCYQNKPRRAR